MYFYSKSTKGFYISEVNGENMPSDVVEITFDKYIDLISMSSHKEISNDKKGIPIVVDRNTPELTIYQKILEIEATITNRRIRDAILGIDNGWLSDAEGRISALRDQL